jgi:hypothetical protein
VTGSEVCIPDLLAFREIAPREIRLRAERKCGQMTAQIKASPGARTDLTSYHHDTRLKSDVLEQAGISRVQASTSKSVVPLDGLPWC